MLATQQVQNFLQYLLAVEPPYRGGILLLPQHRLQEVFFTLFLPNGDKEGFELANELTSKSS